MVREKPSALRRARAKARAKDNRDRVTPQLTTVQLNEAQALASKWVKGQPLPIITKTYPRSLKKKK